MLIYAGLFIVFGIIMRFQSNSIQKMADEAEDAELKAGYVKGAKQRRGLSYFFLAVGAAFIIFFSVLFFTL